MTTRRHALKMLGTIGLTCAYPFAGDELYGQHVAFDFSQAVGTGPYAPSFFTTEEYATLSRLTDLLIPPTDTPGAAAAGVPEYIDRVVSANPVHQPLIRAGLVWLDREARSRHGKAFLEIEEPQQVAILQPLSDEVDRRQRDAQRQRFRTEGDATVYFVPVTDRSSPTPAADPGRPALPPADDPDLSVQLFRLVKNLTADGYYTSRIGLREELGYAGNTALAGFPACTIPEH